MPKPIRFFTEGGKRKPIFGKSHTAHTGEMAEADEEEEGGATVAVIGNGWRYHLPAKVVRGKLLLSEGDLKKLVKTISDETKEEVGVEVLKERDRKKLTF